MKFPYLIHSAAAFSALVISAGSASAAKLSPLGVWYDHTGRGAVEIKSCGKRLCGRVVWTKTRKDSKKGCGRKIIDALRPLGGGVWGDGRIYSPKKKTTYDVEVTPLSRNKLLVVGYLGTKLFSKTMYWKRAPRSLVRCDRPPAAKPDTPIIAQKKEQPVAPAQPLKPARAQPPSGLGAKAKTAAVAPAIVPPEPTRAQRAAAVAAAGKTTAGTSASSDAGTGTTAGAGGASKPAAAGDTQTADATKTDAAAPQVASRDRSSEGDRETRDPAAVAPNEKAGGDEAVGETAEPRKKQRTARYKRKTRCTIKVPFVTVSIPCYK